MRYITENTPRNIIDLLNKHNVSDMCIIDGMNNERRSLVSSNDNYDLINHINKISSNFPYKKICITFDFETNKKEVHIELMPFPGSA